MNLISEQPGKTPGYWCTWGLQNTLAASQDTSNSFGFTGHSLISKTLTEENMLKHSFETNFLENIRGDLFVLYDLGWDVPGDVVFDGNNWMLGSLEVATDKFPSASGTPTERLFKLNEWTKSYGWRGAALWVSANAYGDGKDDIRFSDENLENYFRERMKWSAEAGIEYWKVDYGLRALDHKFREMLTRIGREVAPNLLIEHARNGGPLNDVECPWDTPNVKGTGLFKAWDDGLIYQASVDMVQFSDVFRTYDVSRTLSVPTTLDRVSEMLQAFSETGNTCILNCESEPLIGSVLGCAIGIMGHHQEEGEAQLTDNSHADEYVRAIKWQRMAPAWGVGYGKNYSDTEYLADMWNFPQGSDWVDYLDGSVVKQLAPARVSRGMLLPEVRTFGDQLKPYVICSKNPSGAVSVALLPRVTVESGIIHTKAEVELQLEEIIDIPVGIFGQLDRLIIHFKQLITSPFEVWAQDLAKEEAINITDQISLESQSLIIPGGLVDELCGGSHLPGVVVKLILI